MYSFFIIIDTNNPNCFHIEMTKMNYRLRFSALKSNHIRKYGGNVPVKIHCQGTVYSDNEMVKLSLPGYKSSQSQGITSYQ